MVQCSAGQQGKQVLMVGHQKGLCIVLFTLCDTSGIFEPVTWCDTSGIFKPVTWCDTSGIFEPVIWCDTSGIFEPVTCTYQTLVKLDLMMVK